MGSDSQALLTQIAGLKQQISQILVARIKTLSAELSKMTAAPPTRSTSSEKARPSPSTIPTYPPFIPPTPQLFATPKPLDHQDKKNTNSVKANPQGGYGTNNPFGGLITQVNKSECDCGPYEKVSMNPAKSDLPHDLLYGPSTITYDYKQVAVNQQALGTWETYDTCWQIDGYYCVDHGSFPVMYMVGTSGGSGSGTPPSGSPTPKPSTTPGPSPSAPPDQCKRMGAQAYSYPATGTGYTKENNPMEGGPKDMRGTELTTLQDYLSGSASYVSVAMDTGAFPYGTELCIPEMEQKYGKQIVFKVVDTGGAFTGKGTTRIDICTASQHDASDGTINGSLTLVSSTASKK
jgi:3D (Asp-Asp-Asp) domain-containing protein